MSSTGHTSDIIFRHCKVRGHFARECKSRRVMIATEDCGYESASDYDEETLALITHEEHGGDDSDHETQYMAAEDADRYECLVAQRVLSVQVTQAEQNKMHNLFHTKGVVKECSVRVIIDGGTCNNLASMEMVEKLSLTTRPHPHPYYIQWFNNSGKVKVTRTVRVHLVSLHMLIMLIVMWYLCKHIPYYLVDHGNLIKILSTMVETISILLFIRIKILLCFL